MFSWFKRLFSGCKRGVAYNVAATEISSIENDRHAWVRIKVGKSTLWHRFTYAQLNEGRLRAVENDVDAPC